MQAFVAPAKSAATHQRTYRQKMLVREFIKNGGNGSAFVNVLVPSRPRGPSLSPRSNGTPLP
jgi:hypothetical protein